jgi:hypothetical protein
MLAAVSSCSAASAPVTAPAPVATPSVSPLVAELPAPPAPSVSAAPVEAPLAEHLEPEVIQRVIRQNFGAMRLCYEQSLRASPNLMDRVVVRFVIGKDGAVTSSSAVMEETTMWSTEAILCVVDAVKKLRFPRSAHGVPSVTYPIQFAPGG